MKKTLRFILVMLLALLCLSSCGLFKCKHKEYDVKTVAPTCAEEGYTEHTCKKCGYSYKDVPTQKVAHPYKNVVVSPTCEAEGYTEHICTVCGDSYKDTAVAKISHTYEAEVVPPTCTAEGYTKHTCTACGDSYNDETTAMTAHRFTGAPCTYCSMEEITENITPDTEWYNPSLAVFDLTTPEQLAGLASLVNSGTDFSGVKIYLDADIDLGFYEWIPIGNATYAFNGSFDGDGHTISELKINAGADYVGFFGNVSGKICNFNIEKANIYVKRDHNYVSIACGYSTGDLKDISTDGFIEAPKSNYVGAVAGATAPASIEYTNLTNKANINAQGFVGGIIGQINASGNFQTNYINNTGNVKGVSQVGGIFGYVKGANGSLVSGASVSADIVGDYYVGGIVGRADNVAISTCTNDGSTVTSSSYHTEGSSYYVWLGGIVGYGGYSVTNCTNNIDITYNAKGRYVGGIAGYAVGDITYCTNNGDITTDASYVGGIVGEINSGAERNLSNLTNTGNISGNSNVGGIIGSLYQQSSSKGSEEYKEGSDYHRFRLSTVIKNLVNQGNVSGINYVAGIIGYVYMDSSYSTYVRSCCHYDGCDHYGDFRMVANNLSNNGEINGNTTPGEVFGYFVSDAPSTITTYTVTGKVIENGEVKEGTYDVGSNTNLTLSGREIYTEENPEETE